MSEAEVFATIGDVANEPVAQSGPTAEEHFIYVDIGSVDREAKVIADKKSLAASEAPSRARQVLKAGDVLISMTRPNLNAVAHVPAMLDGAIGSTGFHVLRSQWMALGFLYYLVQTTEFVDAMTSVVQGALYPAVRPADIAKFRFRLPPRAEQTRIVEKLEDLLARLDAAVAELKAAQRKLAHYRQALLKAAVEGALTAEWRMERDQSQETGPQLLQRILQERRTRWEEKQRAKFAHTGKTPPNGWQAKYPEPVAPDTTDLPELPEGWAWASVEQVGDVQLGRQRSPGKLTGIGSTPYIRAANITEDGIDTSDVLEMDFSDTERATFALKIGDVLLTEASGSPEHVGRPAIWQHEAPHYCFQNTVLRFTPQGIGSEFAYYSFLAMQKTGVFKRLSGGVGINHLSAGKFSKLAFALPPLEEQTKITATLETQLAAAKEQETALTHSLQQAAAQRRNLLKAAFAGQLVPQDPNDEPASELLARILAAKADNVKTNSTKKSRRRIGAPA